MKRLLCIFLFLLPALALSAQGKRSVSGTILDAEGQPVIGAYVLEAGTQNGTITDLDGRYNLDVAAGDVVLAVSALGYTDLNLNVPAKTAVADGTLRTAALAIDDVVVVGYGVQNKRDVTTAIVSIKSEDFANQPSSDFREAMAAKLPGVQVTTLGGQPDGNVSVRVRGIQSATSGNDPLYVIDGIPCDARAFANLESGDIESLEVLKDASAAAIYGSRGSCGVILITTKKGSGRDEKAVITYDGQFGVSGVAKTIDMLDAWQWATLYKEARDGAYLYNEPTGSISDPYIMRPETYERVAPMVEAYLTDYDHKLPSTDWQKEIFRTALSHKHTISVSNKTKNISYYVAASYLYREGVIINSDFRRFGFRANVDGKRGNLSYGISLSPSYSITDYVNSESQYGSDGVVACSLMSAPIFPVYNADGSYNWDNNGLLRLEPWDTQVTSILNPVALAKEVKDVRRKANVIGNAYVSYKFIEGLEYKLTMGADYYAYQRDYYRPSIIPLNNYQKYLDPSDPQARNFNNQYLHWNISNQLSYHTTIVEDHNISAVAVFECEKQNIKTAQIYATGTAGDDKIKTTFGKTVDLENTYNNDYSYSFASWLLRAQYSWKGRYMASASIRGDGSSRFAPNTRWGYFPAASLGWRFSDEPFMEGAKSWMNDAKLRVSVGQTGNAQIGNYEYMALYKTAGTDLGGGIVYQTYPTQIANNDLGWEKNTQVDAGLDLTLFDARLRANFDYYYSRTTDMLFDVPVAAVSGFTSANMNIGSMQNQGVEISLGWSDQLNNGFSYSISANWSLNRNKVLSLGDENAPIIKSPDYGSAYFITMVGQPVGCYYLLVQDGIFHDQEELDSYPHFETTTVGDFRYVDVDGDGVMDLDKDRAIVGNYMPDFYYGFSFNFGYQGFDLSANFQGVYGNEILNLERRYILNMEASSNLMSASLNRYPYGELNRATRKSSGYNGTTSSFHIEDGSYLRLQNLSLGYTFPNKWFKGTPISKLRIYVQGSNLFTITNYSGYNPEVNKHSDSALTPGTDYGTYPLARTFTVGINFNL